MRSPRLVLGLALVLAACGDAPVATPLDGPVEPGPDGREPPPTDAPAEPPTDAPPELSPPVTCPPSATGFTLGVSARLQGTAIPAARLGVVFFQLEDDLNPDPPPVFALDQPLAALAAGETRCLDIDLAQIVAPTADAMHLCERACDDLTDPACACPPGPRVVLAYVVVAADVDGDGRIDPDELSKSSLRGVAWMGIAASPAARAASATPPNVLDLIFPEGLEQGVRPYRVIDTDRFDQLGRHQPGTTYQLRLCAEGNDCRVLPNLT